MDNVITNRNGQLSTCDGPAAVNAFRLRTMIQALRFKQRTGMEISRIKILPVAKRETGLKTNKIDVLVAAIEVKLQASIDQCVIINEETR